jgi:hypothetical protein
VTRFLLDMNVLIELIDPAHVQYDRAHEWCRATFDARLVTDAVINGPKPLHLIR